MAKTKVRDLDDTPLDASYLWQRTAVVAAMAGGLNALLSGGLREAFDTDPSFAPLAPLPVAVLSIAGVAIGAAVLNYLSGRIERPRSRWWLVAWVGTLLSLTPNLIFTVAPEAAPMEGPLAGGSRLDWLGLATLHIVAAVVAIPALARTPPPADAVSGR